MKKISFTLLSLMISVWTFAQSTVQTDTLIANITVQQADTLIQAHATDTNFIIIDVRTPSEYNAGFIEDAININYYAANFSDLIDTLNRDKIYLVYCGSGSRSAKARDTMDVKHFVTVYNMLGGTGAWTSAGYTLNTATSLYEITSIEKTNLVYPNPVNDISFLDITKLNIRSGSVSIYNAFGSLVKYLQVNGETAIPVNRSEFENGFYFVRIISEEGKETMGRFIISGN